MTNRTLGPTEWLLLIGLSILWGGSFFLYAVGLSELPPFTLVLGRVALAALVLLLVVYASGRRLPLQPRLLGGYLLLGGISNAIPFSLIAWGQTQIPSGLASILNATTPMFTILVAHLLTRDDRLTANRAVGVLLGLVGVSVLMGPDLLRGLDPYSLGQLAVLGAALCYGFATNYGRRFAQQSPLVNAAGMLAGATVWLLPLSLLLEQPWTLTPGIVGWGAVLGLALLSTALAFLIYFRILAAAGATNIALVTFLVPVSAIALGALFLGERLGWDALAGMGLIFLGIAAVDGRLLRGVRRWLAGGPRRDDHSVS